MLVTILIGLSTAFDQFLGRCLGIEPTKGYFVGPCTILCGVVLALLILQCFLLELADIQDCEWRILRLASKIYLVIVEKWSWQDADFGVELVWLMLESVDGFLADFLNPHERNNRRVNVRGFRAFVLLLHHMQDAQDQGEIANLQDFLHRVHRL